MGWLLPPEDVSCVHVYCADLPGCAYQPPALGPELPRSVTASDGSLWCRYEGLCYYRQRGIDDPPDTPRYGLVTWPGLRRLAEGRRYDYDEFPPGPWTWTAAA